jgi:sugar O-acyltransferase (sialic acid O-acetyltransferase NeuD family)
MSDQVREFAIVGAGGLGHEVLAVLGASRGETSRFLGFISLEPPNEHRMKALNACWLGSDEALSELPNGTAVCVAIGNEQQRRKVTGQVLENELKLLTVLDPSAAIGANVVIGSGSVVLAQASATVHVQIGQGALINPGVRIAHDCVVGSFSSLSPGVILCGDVTLEDEVFVGAGAVICPGVHVGAGARIGAGAVVLSDVKQGATVVGVPARPR